MEQKPIISHALGFVLPRVRENGGLELLIQKYSKPNRRKGGLSSTWRHVMETGLRGARLRLTRERGAHGELFERGTPFKIRVLSKRPVAYMLGLDQDDPSGLHLKTLFAQCIISGQIRQEKIVDGDEILEPPVWVEWEEVMRRMEGNTPKLYTAGTAAVLSLVASQSESVGSRYYRLLRYSSLPDYESVEGRMVSEYIRTHW